jgi:flagellar biosynthesis protein FlhG
VPKQIAESCRFRMGTCQHCRLKPDAWQADRVDLEEKEKMSNQPMTICITSGKGGVGKTSMAVNLALALAQKQRRVLIVDGDLGLANVDIFFGIAAADTIRDVLENGRQPISCVCFPRKGLGVLPAASGVPEMVALGTEDQQQLGRYLTTLFSNFDIILIDTAAGIGASVLWFNSFVHHNLIIITPEPTSITDAYALIKILSKKYGRNRFQIIVNQTADRQEAKKIFEQFNGVAKSFLSVSLDYLGGVPADPVVRQAVREQIPFFEAAPDNRTSASILQIAQKMANLGSFFGQDA